MVENTGLPRLYLVKQIYDDSRLRDVASVLDAELDGFTLNGQVNAIYESGYFQFKCSNIKERDLLRHWLQHLVINAEAG